MNPSSQRWALRSSAFRLAETRQLARWVAAGDSACILGHGGSGKSNFLAALAARPERLAEDLPPQQRLCVAAADLNGLPADDLGTFYRFLLRALRDAAGQLPDDQARLLRSAFQEQLIQDDPFVVQTALYDVLDAILGEGARLVFLFDRFDGFLHAAPPRLLDGLRALRDRHKGSVSYLVGLRQALVYQDHAQHLGELYEVLDRRQLWIGPLDDEAAQALLAEEWPALAQALGDPASPGADPDASWATAILQACGGHPALLKAACGHLSARNAAAPGSPADLGAVLLGQDPVTFRLAELWEGLTQSEQAALQELHRLSERTKAVAAGGSVSGPAADRLIGEAWARLGRDQAASLALLAAKGLVQARADGSWHCPIGLLGPWLSGSAAPSGGLGRLWQDAGSGELLQGQRPLTTLANLERRLLEALLAQPRRRVAKSSLIEQVWPEDAVRAGVMDDALYQVIKELRRKIEPDPARPVYLVTYRAQPEGGYQLFPEGRPQAEAVSAGG